ncbi:hypothetical protein [Anaerovibrio sp.]|uniref:hypothetical protein n=1 Tax=Anaerovibrio sp. TaxID=1872532 RepID=UPI0034356113
MTGTNQCSAWIRTGVAAYEYVKSGNLHLKLAMLTLPFVMIGSYIGANLNLVVSDYYLKLLMI